ncbi:hypothetical protein BRN51_01840 [Xanthomonas oryzae pv. oryzae]|nr:hypothetical protein BRN51_01840 [Xanthomonas oryzae pv. oryzae]RBF84636.1 hypothetical protein BRM95_14810 [Xanthomonas oryzae pv. oryzae]RBK69576.1 hypothetical protein BRN49_03735 [Xanthomonas oryzae pv. oryzae]
MPTHPRGTLSGMDAAPGPKRTYLRRVLRWWRALALQPGRRSTDVDRAQLAEALVVLPPAQIVASIELHQSQRLTA